MKSLFFSLLSFVVISLILITSCESTKRSKQSDDLVMSPSLEQLKNNNNITWIREIMIDCSPSYDHYTNDPDEKNQMKQIGFKNKNTIKVLKQQLNNIDKESTYYDDHDLRVKLMKHHKDIASYKDADLNNKNTQEEHEALVYTHDTIITFNPKTFEEIVEVVKNPIDPNAIKYFSLKCYLYYDNVDKMFKVKTLSMAPVCVFNFSDTSEGFHRPLYWMPVDDHTNDINLNQENINWATRIYRTFDHTQTKMIKGDQDVNEVLNQMMADLRKGPEKYYLGTIMDEDGICCPMDSAEIANLGNSVDTVITYDPETFEQTVEVVDNKFDPNFVKTFRMIQDWSWDCEKNEVQVKYQGFMPVLDRMDDNGNVFFSSPAFVRRVGFDK